MNYLRHNCKRCHNDWVMICLEGIEDKNNEWIKSFKNILFLFLSWYIIYSDNLFVLQCFLKALESKTSHDSSTDLFCLLESYGL